MFCQPRERVFIRHDEVLRHECLLMCRRELFAAGDDAPCINADVVICLRSPWCELERRGSMAFKMWHYHFLLSVQRYGNRADPGRALPYSERATA
jgi:hypothetical protein